MYPTSHAKSNTTSKHHHTRVNSGTEATTFHHTRTHSIHRDTNHQNSPTRSGKVKSQHHSNTQSRELPRYLSRTARESVGDTFHYPHYSTPTPEAKHTRKKHHLCGVQKQHSRTAPFHHHPNGEYDVPIRGKFILLDLFCPEETQQNKTHPTIGWLHKLSAHCYSPETQQNYQFSTIGNFSRANRVYCCG